MKKLLVLAILLSLVGMVDASRRHCGKKCNDCHAKTSCHSCHKSCHKTCDKVPCCEVCKPCCDQSVVTCEEPQTVCSVVKRVENRPCKKVVLVEDEQPWEVCQKTICKVHTSERCMGDCGSATGAPIKGTEMSPRAAAMEE